MGKQFSYLNVIAHCIKYNFFFIIVQFLINILFKFIYHFQLLLLLKF